MSDDGKLIERNLQDILSELKAQPEAGAHYPPGVLPFDKDMAQIQEFIDVGEGSLAYEYMVADLESFPFRLSGAGAIRLLEVGLLMGFKTKRPKDLKFDNRRRTA